MGSFGSGVIVDSALALDSGVTLDSEVTLGSKVTLDSGLTPGPETAGSGVWGGVGGKTWRIRALTVLVCQLMSGLAFVSHGIPRIMV